MALTDASVHSASMKAAVRIASLPKGLLDFRDSFIPKIHNLSI